MPLLLLDLGNTRIDRDAAFRDAVAAFLAGHGLPAGDLTWLTALDAGGSTPRHEVAAAVIDRYGGAVPAAAVRSLPDHGAAGRAVLTDSAREALERARSGGWTCVIVTNGRTAQQEAKIRRTGLDRHVRGWVVSEAVGHSKPDPVIFRAAAEAAGTPLAGADALGLRSVWVSNGRSWSEDAFRPTHVAGEVDTAIDHALG
ncbi:HAD family hydrolase [Streptomyces sp. NPDC093065]|uniref:HAD family hydrolase n=1 Tax=Streptomyces sp. NPDC093065 TaxID=3366021 RepID=UPI0038192716